ncbi:hypothetical protein LSCM1_06598 [Leishmania martiniquensis]|uniref:AAA+ ATPase domain-containing protein n=1 Tax=Leishmania martiniquensis TaxID=1580590 RepID=A0A836KRH0_9TRYP|nr:hypothetical protein LSCM1_06598 [Leishmania martiniquensis]
MVLTRSQAKRGRSSDDEEGDGSSVVGSVSSDASTSGGEGAHRGSAAKSSSPAGPAAAKSDGPACGQRGASLLTSPQGERLGRGCRVPHTTVSLDEEYLVASLRRSKTLQRFPAYHDNDEDDGVSIRSRYPQREAAKRALQNLRSTLAHPNGAARLGSSGAADEEDGDSNSMGAFNFRHHPELQEEIRKARERHRRRRRSRSSDSDDDEDETTTSSSCEESAEGGAPVRRVTRGRPRLSKNSLGTAAAPAPNSHAATATRRVRAADAEIVSINSSISDASMREESVERMAQQDQRADPSSSSSESGEGGRNGEFMTDAQRRHALRQAHESVAENININHYMVDAIGVKDSKRVRRRQLDRRYRWLLHQEEDARARADGYGGSAGAAESGSGSAATAASGALGDISPLQIDDGITFDSVGGLPEHIVTLREMVLLPLLYPDLFERLDLRAPRGILFVGPPGTGKTLMARALANEGSLFARGTNGGGASSSPPPPHQQPGITFFVRKGADILSKWVGESERQLKLLFEEARRLQPSIIFFDEVDGLAPARHAKVEQTQAALVSTLLALLDGLEDRGQVIVIGATNRPDTLDPALRRPGRFDRELVFPLPDAAARRHILTIQLAKKVMPVSAEQRAALLEDLVEMTEGYTGADLAALCTEASLHRLRSAMPQLYLSSQRLLIPRDVEQAQLQVRTEDFYAAAQLMQPSLRRPRSRGLSGMAETFLDPYIEVLLRGTRDATLAALAPSWSLIDKALRAGSRDCRDMATAVRSLCSAPIPQPPRPCLLVLREATEALSSWRAAAAASVDRSGEQYRQQRALRLHHLTVSLLKGLPRLPQLTVHLPQLSWDDTTSKATLPVSATVADDYLGDAPGTRHAGVSFMHMGHVMDSVRQCSPCIVHLSGAEEWLRGCNAEQGTNASDLSSDDDGVVHGGAEAASHMDSVQPGISTTSLDAKADADGAEGRSPVRQQLSRRRQQLVQTFCYYLSTVADTDVIFVLPCSTAATCELLTGPDKPASVTFQLGAAAAASSRQEPDFLSPSSPLLEADPPSAVHLRRISTRQHLLHPQFSVVVASVSVTPLPADLRRFVEYIYRIVAMTLQLHHRTALVNAPRVPTREPEETGATVGRAGALVVDKAPPPSPFSAANLRARRRADRAQRCELWRKVEYRRLQLRHVLMKWVSQYINSGKFKLLANADLDLAPDDPQLKSWQQHTRHHRIGLQDILEKIEDEAYVCLSQYHDDIDQLVRNVRSFFRTRAAQDQRYRLKALDLKETCLLNMYKMNRTVIRFCEETRDVQEPSSDEEADHVGEELRAGPDGPRCDPTALVCKDADPALIAEHSRRAMHFSLRLLAPERRKPRRYYGERRRRRRPRKASKAEVRKEESDHGGDDEGSDEAGGRASSKVSAAEGHAAVKGDIVAGGVGTATPDVATGAAAAPMAVTSAQDWACGLLSSFSYTRLHQVFKSMMRGLELEVRSAASMAVPTAPAGEAFKPNGVSGVTPVAMEGRERASDAYVEKVFRMLVLAAVGE